jgi:uncharacterized membrane protein
MLELLPIQFDKPIWLLLILLIVPVFFIGRRSIGGLSRTKATVVFALRSLVIVMLAVALAEPVWARRGEGVTVTILLDRSNSVPLALKKSSADFMRRAVDAKDDPVDRVAVISIGRESSIAALPDAYSGVPDDQALDPADLTATNLADGMRIALALVPDDTANRIVLVSDGNETIGNVMEAAELARANNIPIDVLALEYEHDHEVIFERINAPARAREGQSLPIKLVMRSQGEATGTVHLTMNGEPQDLDPSTAGTGLAVTLKPGTEVIPLTVAVQDPGPVRFAATFEPDTGVGDTPQNNTAVAVTFVGGQGRVLIVDDGTVESAPLAQALTEAGVAFQISPPEALVGGLVYLSGFDAVVLANIPRYAITPEQDKMLHAYVHDLGGGLIMLGGPESFGAGGWNDSEVAKALPVRLDPPQTRQIQRGALALIMHSCEMAQGNYWGEQVAIASIKALSRLDYLGIIEYNWQAIGLNGCSWAFPLQIVGDKQPALAAVKQMAVGDMPDFGSSMKLAYDGLLPLSSGSKHVVIISDGDPAAPPTALVNAFAAAGITITTVMVAGHGSPADNMMMQQIASRTGGRFHNVTDPKKLPQIFIQEAQLVSRSLIVEGDTFRPQVVSQLPGPIEGFAQVPSITGYVLTAMREGVSNVPIVSRTTEGDDPIFAYWNFGIGKTIAYTSDITGRWGQAWVSWSQFRAFWEQAIRWAMRPSSPANVLVTTRQDGDRAIVEVEAVDLDASFINFLRTSAVVLRPDSAAEPFSLQQVGPGRYRGEFRTFEEGPYLVNVSYAAGGGENALQGSVQAAVTVSYPPEFAAVKHNKALLEKVAHATKGRVLEAGSPEAMALFDRTNLEIPRTNKPVWDLLVILAASLFLLDVASRRIAVDIPQVVGFVRRGFGRRADTSGAAVAAWKRARAGVTEQRASARRASRIAAAPSAESDRAARYEATEEDMQSAVDIAGEQGAKAKRGDEGSSAPAQAKPQAAPAEEEDYTSRLLKAKRRARGDKPDEDDKGASGGGGERG